MFATLILFIISSFGDYLYNKEDYFRAISEYKRDLFYEKDSLNAIVKIGRSYFNLDRLEDALYWYGKVYYKDTSYKLEYGYVLALSGKFDEVDMLISGDNKKERKLRDLINFVQIDQDYWKMSYIIPGSGQILSGRVREGIFSFIGNTGSLYLIYDRLIKKRDIIGCIFAISYFLKSYVGNISSSKKYESEKRTKEFKRKMGIIKKDFFVLNDIFNNKD